MLARWQAGLPLAAALNAEAGGPRFVPQAELPGGEGYEDFIRRSGRVPTRENAHDFFNGLVWLRYPALKARLNAWHALESPCNGGPLAAQSAPRGPLPAGSAPRGPLRDALTLLDENGALLHDAPPALVEALRARAWRRLFVELRPLWAGVRLELVGHGLLEKLLQPRKPICAHLLLAEPERPEALAAKPFLPLPVLGVPGWWSANAQPSFYDDAAVFRPQRAAQSG